MADPIRRLPDAELEVMQALWACDGPATRADLEQMLAPTHPMATTTLLTLLTRLKDKGFILVQPQGRSRVYTPLVTQEAYLAHQSRRFLHKLCGGKLPVFASALCDSGLSKEELQQLRKLLEEGE